MNNAFLIMIGTELLIGQTVDTNSAWIGKELNKKGIWVSHKITIADQKKDIEAAIRYAVGLAPIVIISGGLGLTSDDVTKQTIADFIGSKGMREDADAALRIEKYFSARGAKMDAMYKEQARIPEGCAAIPNSVGLASGIWFDKKGYDLIAVPGVPSEMRAMFSEEILDKLAAKYSGYIEQKYLLTSGMGESLVSKRLQNFEKKIPEGISLAYLPSEQLLRLRLGAMDRKRNEKSSQTLRSLHQELVAELSDIAITDKDISLEEELGNRLRSLRATVSTAESCTGGYIAHLITSIAGSSAYYKGSIIAYDNEIKKKLLGVSEGALSTHGAVSEETVSEMLGGALSRFGSSYAIATSGIMGPSGATPTKPIGCVCIAVGSKEARVVKTYRFHNDRMRNIVHTARAAMVMLIRFMEEYTKA